MRRSILSARHLRTAPDPVDGPGTGGGSGGGPVVPAVTPAAPTPDDKGFPEATPVADMKPEEQANYWKFQARKHENAYKGVDIDALKAKAAAHDAAEAAKLTPSEQAIREAREAGKAEANAEANTRAANAILRASLSARGKTADEIAQITAFVTPAAFIANGDVDTDKVSAFVNQFVAQPAATVPGMGQGPKGPRAQASSVAAGREMFSSSRSKSS